MDECENLVGDLENFEENLKFNEDIDILEGNTMGQSESKKSSKKDSGIPETKGTAMSFGFRKKINTTPKKNRKDKGALEAILDGKKYGKNKKKPDEIDTIGSSQNKNDNNGNLETIPVIMFEKVGATAKTPSLSGENADDSDENNCGVGTTTTNRCNRFGFKGTNIVRPASAGIAPKYRIDFDENFEGININEQQSGYGSNNSNNNNENGKNSTRTSIIKRRSKSAHSGRTMTPNQFDLHTSDESRRCSGAANTPKINQKTITFNLSNNNNNNNNNNNSSSSISNCNNEHQRKHSHQQISANTVGRPMSYTVHPPQYTFVNTAMHTNVIIRPTSKPPAATYSKFTLQTTSLPKPEFAVPVRLNPAANVSITGGRAKEVMAAASTKATASVEPFQMDQKAAKQIANSNRREFGDSREISADSGIASLDATLNDVQHQSSSSAADTGGGRSRSRPRNLQMVMYGRHKFEVRDLDDPLSYDSCIVEPLALPKLPSAFSSDNQTAPLSGLVRSNTVLSRELFFRTATVSNESDASVAHSSNQSKMHKTASEESESVEEEKLYLDRSASEKEAKKYHFKELNTCSSKTSSPCSSRISWCNAGESLAIKDCSSFSISSSDDSKEHTNEKSDQPNLPSNTDDQISPVLFSELQSSFISSLTESTPSQNNQNEVDSNKLEEKFSPTPLNSDVRRKSEGIEKLYNSINVTKFAEIAAAGSEFFLEDETSPTDSLISSTESEDAVCKKQKREANEEIQEKDIDKISPELDIYSPVSPGTPTHVSRSFSLSDCARDFLIDDEIADQPALVFNDSTAKTTENKNSHKGEQSLTESPTLKETSSMRSLKSQSKARSALKAAIELSLRTPLSLRKAVLNHAESLDTLSPCESLCSDDLMMDFEGNSSIDSIDKLSTSMRSQSGSALNKLDDSELFAELENKGNEMMKELNTILRVHSRTTEKDSVIANLPARATRLLNRSRLQQCQLSNTGSDSPKSTDSFRRTPSRTSSLHHSVSSSRDTNSSSDDLMLYDKSFRNAMIQDVLHFKKQLLRLRRILQETETINPFENDNGLFAACGLDGKLLNDIELASLTSSTTDNPLQELADLRRQVVYLQGQVEDRDRTIRQLQKSLIDKNKFENEKTNPLTVCSGRECINIATQTERTRPLSIGPDGLSRSKPEYTSYTTYFPVITSEPNIVKQQEEQQERHQQKCVLSSLRSNHTRRHTIISTTFTNYNQISPSPRRSSIGWEKSPIKIIPTYKPVKITLIGDSLPNDYRQQNGVCKETDQSQQREKSTNGVVDEENKKNLLNDINGVQQKFKFPIVNGNHHYVKNGIDNNLINGSKKNDEGEIDNSCHSRSHQKHNSHQNFNDKNKQQLHLQIQRHNVTPITPVTIV